MAILSFNGRHVECLMYVEQNFRLTMADFTHSQYLTLDPLNLQKRCKKSFRLQI